MHCSHADCPRPIEARGLCAKHYLRWRRHGDSDVSKINRDQTGKPCKFEGCSKPSGRRGFCTMHYQRLVKNGSAGIDSARQHYRAREKWIEANITFERDECLQWPFPRGENGRGWATLSGRETSAPFAICTIAHGPRPSKNHETAHSCGKGHEGCVNPRHLRWATRVENEADKRKHGTLRKGTLINTSKLNEADVVAIRQSANSTGVEMAKQYGVSTAAISAIRTRKSWAWL